MNQKEFLNRVVCPRCNTKLDQKAPFNNGLVCNCRSSLQKIIKSSRIERSFKLYLSSELIIFVCIYSDENKPWFYIASEDRPFYPLYEQREIPDYIFLPIDKLIPKIELLTTFS